MTRINCLILVTIMFSHKLLNAQSPAVAPQALLQAGSNIMCYPMAYDSTWPRTSSGATTMTGSVWTHTFTTSATTSLTPGDIIIPTTTRGQTRVITSVTSGTAYKVAPQFDSAVAAQTYTIRKGTAATSSGAVTLTAVNGAATFTTSTSITLNAGDLIVPTASPGEGQKISISSTGTSFTIEDTFTANITASTFNIFKGTFNGIAPWVPQSSNVVWHWGMHGPVGPMPSNSMYVDYIGSGNNTARACASGSSTLFTFDQGQGGVGSNDRTVLATRFGANVYCDGMAISLISNNISVGGWKRQYAEESGAITMTAVNAATTFTTSASVTLAVGDFIAPYTAASRQWRKVSVGGTGTSFTVSAAFTAAVTGSKFRILRAVQTYAGSPYNMSTTSQAPWAGWSIMRSGTSETAYLEWNSAKVSDGTALTVGQTCSWNTAHHPWDGDWHHLMWTITGTITSTPGAGVGTIKLYFDGQLSTTCNITGGANNDFGAGIASGTGLTDPDVQWLWRADSNSTASPTYYSEWTVWNSLLSPTDVANIYKFQNCFNVR